MLGNLLIEPYRESMPSPADKLGLEGGSPECNRYALEYNRHALLGYLPEVSFWLVLGGIKIAIQTYIMQKFRKQT